MKQNKPNPHYRSYSRKDRKWQPKKKNRQHRRDFHPDHDQNDNRHREDFGSRPEMTRSINDCIHLPLKEKSPFNSGNTDTSAGLISQLMSWFRKDFSFWVKPATYLNEVKKYEQ